MTTGSATNGKLSPPANARYTLAEDIEGAYSNGLARHDAVDE
jgi:hypothetical protein